MSEPTGSADADATEPTDSAELEADSTEPTDPDVHGGPTLSALAEEASSEEPRNEDR